MAYVVYQAGQAILGVGDTRDDAKADAARWLDMETPRMILDAPHPSREVEGTLYLRECSDALIAHVQEHGGDVPYTVGEDEIVYLTIERVDSPHLATVPPERGEYMVRPPLAPGLTPEAIAEELRALHEAIPGMAPDHIQYRLRTLYRQITGTDPWPEP
jgi:hypothetical protein